MAKKGMFVDEFHMTGALVEKRIIMLTSANFDAEASEMGVDSKMAEVFLKNMLFLEAQSNDPITIVMNNIGGDWYHGMVIYDAIKLAKSHISIHVYGHAFSMGSIVLQAADTRLMAPNASQMVHYGNDGFHAHSQAIARHAKETARINSAMEDIYLERIREKHPKFSGAHFRKAAAHDWFLTAQQSVDMGLADGILGEEQ